MDKLRLSFKEGPVKLDQVTPEAIANDLELFAVENRRAVASKGSTNTSDGKHRTDFDGFLELVEKGERGVVEAASFLTPGNMEKIRDRAAKKGLSEEASAWLLRILEAIIAKAQEYATVDPSLDLLPMDDDDDGTYSLLEDLAAAGSSANDATDELTPISQGTGKK